MTAALPATEPESKQRTVARTTLGSHATVAAFWNTVLLPAKLGSHLLAQLVLANALSKTEYGVYVLALSIGVTSGNLVDLGTERSVVKFLPEVAGREGRTGVRRLISWVFWVKMALLLPAMVLVTIFHATFFRYLTSRVPEVPADRLNDPVAIADHDRLVALVHSQQWAILGSVLSLVIIGAIYDVAMQSLVATFSNRSWNLITIVVTLADPLTVTFIVLLGGNIALVLAGRVAVALFALALAGLTAILAVRDHVDEERLFVTREQQGHPLPPQRFALYSGLQYALQVTSFVTSYAFAVLILPNADEIAGYRVANGSVRDIIAAITVPIIGIQVPIFTRIFSARDDEQLRNAYALVSRCLVLLLVPGMIGLAILIPNLYRALFPQYLGYIGVAVVLILFFFPEACLSTGTTVLLTYERYPPVILARGIALLTAPVLFFTAPRFGAMGAGLTAGFFALLSAIVGTIASNIILPIRFPLGFARRVLIASACMAVVIGGLALTVARVPDNAGGGLHRIIWLGVTGIVGIIGVAVFLIAFRLIGGIDASDAERVRHLRLPGWLIALVHLLLGEGRT
jgi:O-antigen/teichoic acid export membrane protein